MCAVSIDPDLVGRRLNVADVQWGERDVMLYALGVGAGQTDPQAELEFTTENARDVPLQVLPTFGLILAHRLTEAAPGYQDVTAVLHAEQSLQLPEPLPVRGVAALSGRVTGVYDKGSGALVVLEGAATERTTGKRLLTMRSSIFVRGAGGFGGERGPAVPVAAPPDRAPDHELACDIRPDQPLLYRLSGDRNPLHADPVVAREAGFERPILHGLCSLGCAARLLLHAVCDSDPARFRSISARFAAPMLPGETLKVRAWNDRDQATFRALRPDGTVVLDHGVLERA